LPRFHYRSVSEAVILHLIGWSEFWGALQVAWICGIALLIAGFLVYFGTNPTRSK
jgi:hypothetical protein